MSYFREAAGPHSVLSILLTFPHPEDTVYLAHCYPFTYTDLVRDLASLRHHPQRSR